MVRQLLTISLIVASVSPVLADDFHVQGPNGREVVLHNDGNWDFTAPLETSKTSVGERTLQVLDARTVTTRTLQGGTSEGGGATHSITLRVQYRVESSHPPTQYDPPEILQRVEAINPENGEILAKDAHSSFNSRAMGFVWPTLRPGTLSDVNSVEFQRTQGWPQKISLRFVYKKSYTPPPNETTFDLKDVPVLQ